MADAKAEAKHLIEQSNARIENTIRNIREAQAEKEKTKNLRNELAEFKTQIETDTDEQDRIARKIAKIQRRQQRKADGASSAKAKSAAEQKIAATKLRNLSNSNNSQSVSPSNNNKILRAGSYVRIIGQSSIGRVESISGKSARVLFGMLYTQVNQTIPFYGN